MPKFSAHYCHGVLSTAFVLSVPGADKVAAGKPVSGDTGTNLDAALVYLHSADPNNFPSTERYKYRITNASKSPLATSLGHSFSEAREQDILERKNVERIIRELDGCKLVILCGRKAQLLARALELCGKRVVLVPHPGNRGLNNSYPDEVAGVNAVGGGAAARPTVGERNHSLLAQVQPKPTQSRHLASDARLHGLGVGSPVLGHALGRPR